MTSNSTKSPLDDAQLRIKLAAADDAGNNAEQLVADRSILAAFSSCVRGLPIPADGITVWDISQLLIEGRPVQRQTVVAWLNKAYSQILDEPFEQQKPNPACSMTGLAQLLAFADAVGSSKGLVQACLSDLEDLSACVTAPGGTGGQAKLKVDARCHWSFQGTLLMRNKDTYSGLTFSNTDDKARLSQQVATQLEPLLFLAHKLQLPELLQKLHTFIRVNSQSVDSLLYGSMGLALTDRVLEAAVSKQQIRELVINTTMTERGGFSLQKHAEQLLQPLNLTCEQQAPLAFKAKFTREALGFSKGQTVSVELQLLSERQPYIELNGQRYVAQLLVGTAVWDTQSMQALMGPGPAAAESADSEA